MNQDGYEEICGIFLAVKADKNFAALARGWEDFCSFNSRRDIALLEKGNHFNFHIASIK